MKRTLIVDIDNQYSDKEVQIIQEGVDKQIKGIRVFMDLLDSGIMALCANADIQLSYPDICDMIGEAYIEGVSG